MNDESEFEFAMMKHDDGRVVRRSAARRSMMNALTAQGGQVGPDGRPMRQTAEGAWVPRPAEDENPSVGAGSPLAELVKRQAHVGRQIRQTRLDQEVCADHALIRSASPVAWKFARLYSHGLLPQPRLDASPAALVGWRLWRRHYDAPPAWLQKKRQGGAPARGESP